MMGWYSFKPYVSVAARRANAAREVERLVESGRKISPIESRRGRIVETFWGTSWCENLEAYSDFENRLPRGRTYVRNGSVVDLQIEPGKVIALVNGNELYEVEIAVKPLPAGKWDRIQQSCAGRIGTLIELLSGKLNQRVMEVVTNQESGLFPSPDEIEMKCSCPDWAGMCKHVAAVMYGIGIRLDEKPEMLFSLRQVNHLELVSGATSAIAKQRGKSGLKTLSSDILGDVFGIELAAPVERVDPPTLHDEDWEIEPPRKRRQKRKNTGASDLKKRLRHR